MVGAAPTEHRVLQRSAQAWQRFAGIQQLSVGAGQEVNIATHFAGDARERLYKIERGAFAGSARRARDRPARTAADWL